jgi:predicted membrane protein
MIFYVFTEMIVLCVVKYKISVDVLEQPAAFFFRRYPQEGGSILVQVASNIFLFLISVSQHSEKIGVLVTNRNAVSTKQLEYNETKSI